MPRYLTLYTTDVPSSGPPSSEHMEAMGKLIERMQARGALVAFGATTPGSFSVRLAKGACTIADLPRGGDQGFAILNATDRADAEQLTRDFLAVAGDGVSVVHPLMGPPPG
jgi:hypothetical protein